MIYRPASTIEGDDVDDGEDDGESTDQPEPAAGSLIPSTLDDDPEVGVIENWTSHYGHDEQMARFASYSTRPDLLRRLFALEASTGATATFQSEWIEAAKDLALGVDHLDRSAVREARIIVGVDPARAAGARASYFAIVTVAFLPPSAAGPALRIVLDVQRERGVGSVEVQGGMVAQAIERWRAEVAAIEAVAGYGYLSAYCAGTLHLPVKPITTTRADADAVPALANEFARGQWRIPWADARSQRLMAPLIGELHDYPGGSTDLLMACSFAHRTYFETPAPTRRMPRIEFVSLS